MGLLLQKDPQRRYELAEALADDLRRWREGRPITARPASPFEHAWRWCRRRPAIAALAATLILTLAAGFVGLVVLLKHAEAERAQAVTARRLAEENEKAAMATIKQLALLASTAASDDHPLLGERVIATGRVLRDRIGELKDRPGFDKRLLGSLGIFDRLVAVKLEGQGQQEEARALLAESIALLEENRRFQPADQPLIKQHVTSLIGFAAITSLEEEVDQALDCLARAEALLPALASLPECIAYWTRLSDIRLACADRLAVRGDADRHRRVLEANLRMVNSPDTLGMQDPKLAVCKARTLASIGKLAQARELLRSTLENDSVDRVSREQLERTLAGLAARRFRYLEPAAAEFSASGPDEADPGAWADALLASVHARCRAFGIDPSVTPEVVWGSAPSAFQIAVEQRQAGKLAEARRTGERFRALAGRLVTLYPDRPASYMVLSEAFIHQSKAAWKDNDMAAVERADRQALDAARHALSLDPHSEDARRLIEKREQRVARLRDK